MKKNTKAPETKNNLETAYAVQEKLISISLETIEQIFKIVKDPTANAAVRLQAGQSVLKFAQPLWEQEINRAHEAEQDRRNLENWADMGLWPKAE